MWLMGLLLNKIFLKYMYANRFSFNCWLCSGKLIHLHSCKYNKYLLYRWYLLMIYIYLVFVIFDENASVLLKLQPGRNCWPLLGCCTKIQFNVSEKMKSAFPPSLSRMKLCKYTQAMMTPGMLWSKLMWNVSLLNFPFKRANALSITDLVELCMILYLVSSSFRLPTSLNGVMRKLERG